VEIPDETVLKIATAYTREAGVRNLEREIASLCRAVAVKVASHEPAKAQEAEGDGEEKSASAGGEEGVSKSADSEAEAKVAEDFDKILIDLEKLQEISGPEKYYNETAERTSVPGVATGLAWTAAGGDLLFIEATRMGGKGSLILTGQLGDVMKESAQTALSWIRSRAVDFGLSKDMATHFLDKTDIHLHFPAGAIPKDGPSAGVTIITALVSLMTGRRARPDTAMTGEVTLRGLVLPVGGIKEKVLAAHRGGCKRVILPARNEKDLLDIPQNVKDDMSFVFAKHVDEVLEAALEGGHPAADRGKEVVTQAPARA
jgi:ATP-dependent Lon protease